MRLLVLSTQFTGHLHTVSLAQVTIWPRCLMMRIRTCSSGIPSSPAARELQHAFP